MACISFGVRNIQRHFSTQAEWQNALPFAKIPGPKGVPIFGNLWRFLPIIGDLYNLDPTQLLVEMNRRFGDIARLDGIPGKAPFLVLSNAEDLSKVIRTEGEFPVRDAMQSTRYYREYVHSEPYDRVGHLLDNGYNWKKCRTRVNQLLLVQSNIAVYKEAISQVTDDFISRIKQTRNQKNETPPNFLSELEKWAFEVVGVVAFGHRFDCFQDTLSAEVVDTLKAMEDFHETTYSLDVQLLPLYKYFTTSTFNKMTSALNHLQGISEKYVTLAAKKSFDNEPKSIVQNLVNQGEDGKDVAVVFAVDMLLAGVQIIAGMSATILYTLSKHRHSQQWLTDKVCSQSQEPVQPFVQAFIKETMRLWPAAIGTLRSTGKDIVLSGYRVPKGTSITICNYNMCRNPLYFDNPLEFCPERWLKSDKLKFSKYAFAPFGIGARSCVGRRVAMLELEIFLIKILSSFEVQYKYGDVTFESKFLNLIRSPLQFTMIDRR